MTSRGGSYSTDSTALGIFTFGNSAGDLGANADVGFRAVLVI